MHRPIITENGYSLQLVHDYLQPIALKNISWLAPATPCAKRGKLSIKVNIPTTNSHYLETQYKAGRPSMFSPTPRCFPLFSHRPSPSPHTLTVLDHDASRRLRKVQGDRRSLLSYPKWHTIVPVLMSSSPLPRTAPALCAKLAAKTTRTRLASAAIKGSTIPSPRCKALSFLFKVSSTYRSILQVRMRLLRRENGPEIQP